MAKRKYTKMEMTQVGIELSGILMKGSLTSVPIKVNEVSVEDFKDGFASDGGFQELNFD